MLCFDTKPNAIEPSYSDPGNYEMRKPFVAMPIGVLCLHSAAFKQRIDIPSKSFDARTSVRKTADRAKYYLLTEE